MDNPNEYTPMAQRVSVPYQGKVYLARLVRGREHRICRHADFRTASAAVEYAQRVKARWCRLYQAALPEVEEPESKGGFWYERGDL